MMPEHSVDNSLQPSEPGSAQAPHQSGRGRSGMGSNKKYLFFGGIAVAILLLAAGGAWFFFGRTTQSAKAPAAAPNTQTQTETELEQGPTDATPVIYKSAKLNIELTHRKDWTLKEAAGGSELVLTSPRITYTKANATAGTNVFTLKVRKGVPEAMKATIEKAVAVRDSEVIAYAAPTESQRYYTNISYAGNGENFHFFLVTGSVAFKSGNAFTYALTLGDDTYLLAGGFGADTSGNLSFDPIPKGSIDTDVTAQALDIVKSLKIF